MDPLPSYFDSNPVRLDEFDGTLRRDIPEHMRESGGQWVLLRRYIPKSMSLAFQRDRREFNRELVYVDGVAPLSEEQIARQNAIAMREVEAHLIEWSYPGLPLSTESLDALPSVHVDAMLTAVQQMNNPRSDEEAKSLFVERTSGNDARLNGHRPSESRAVLEDAIVGAAQS